MESVLISTPARRLTDVKGGLRPNPAVCVSGGVIVYQNRRFENAPAKKGRRWRRRPTAHGSQDSIWSFMR